MKPRRPSRTVFLSPATRGWRLRADAESAPVRHFSTLQEAAAVVPAEASLHLALPAGAVLLERMRLPATNPAELADMMNLQLEKTLPFPAEEVTSGLRIIERTESETLLLALAISNEQLDTLCAPLLARRLLPTKITFFAMHLATFPEGKCAALIYAENEKTVFAICENGQLGYVHSLDTNNAGDFFAELPQLLLSAELDGVPVAFERVRLDDALNAWSEQVQAFFNAPVETFSTDAPVPEPALNFVPARWLRDRAQLARSSRLRDRLVAAGIAYLLLLLLAAGAIFFMQRRLTALDQQLRAAQPQVDLIAAQKERWQQLAPAIEPGRYPADLLLQVFNSLPSEDLRLTSFNTSLRQFTLKAEAPTANAAVEFGDRLKKNAELKDFSFEVAPPTILANDHAELTVTAKL